MRVTHMQNDGSKMTAGSMHSGTLVERYPMLANEHMSQISATVTPHRDRL